MLGTAFYKNSRKSNFWRTYPNKAFQPKEFREKLWIEVLRNIGDVECTVSDIVDSEFRVKEKILSST
jgi:hypothetical protein